MIDPVFANLLKMGAVILLVLANGFFVAAEFSLVSVRRTRIAELASHGDKSAKAVQDAITNPDRVIAATQLGITIASLGLGWIGEPALAGLIYPLVTLFPADFQTKVSHTISAVIAFLIITFLHVVAGELAPKSIALQYPERTSLAVARPTLLTERIFKPAIWLLNGAGNALIRLFGVKPASGQELAHSIEELKMLVSASAESGVVEAEEREMVHAILGLGDLVVRQVMIPRMEIIAVEADLPLAEIIQLISSSTYTKFPVYEDNLDQILGIVHVKDLLYAMQNPQDPRKVARDFAREALYVPDTIGVSALLRQFRNNRQHIAISMDEYGGTSGLITLEDLLEEIVGEVSDPFDVDHPQIRSLPDGLVMIDGLTLIEEVNEQLHLDLNDPDYDTIAGYVLGKLRRMAQPLDFIESNGVRLQVEEMDGLRIARVSLTRLQNPLSEEAPSDLANPSQPESPSNS
jgi:CBS domain containing-hemolysin-like protein